MADQEFLVSFALKIDEAGVSRLQAVLEETGNVETALVNKNWTHKSKNSDNW